MIEGSAIGWLRGPLASGGTMRVAERTAVSPDQPALSITKSSIRNIMPGAIQITNDVSIRALI